LGQKTHPIGFRLGIIRTWNSRWYAPDNRFADLVHEDLMVKRYINKRLDNAGIANVCISRAPKKVTVDIHTSRPGIVIGRKGTEVDKLREELQMLTKKDILLNIVEVRKPELNAQLVADSIARQLVGRVSFRRAMKKSLAATMKMGAMGIKITCGGRLGGAEIARSEKYREGRVPLHTLRADIDYATATAHTTYGCIGVKVWICRGEILEMGKFYETDKKDAAPADAMDMNRRRPGRDGGGDRGGKKRPRGKVRRRPEDGRPSSSGSAPRGRRPERPTGEFKPAPRPGAQAAPKAAPPVGAKKAAPKADAKKAAPKADAKKAAPKADAKKTAPKPVAKAAVKPVKEETKSKTDDK
jgi:small subunit ribosomal protein S3